MIKSSTYDIFITHAWRYHLDWKRMTELLNAHGMRHWRNFSLPWYDPALDPRTEDGGKVVRWNLESQIIPAHAVILLASVLNEPGTHKWLDFELEMARKHQKPIIVVPCWGQTDVPPDVRQRADTVVGWDAAALFAAVKELRHQPAPVAPALAAISA